MYTDGWGGVHVGMDVLYLRPGIMHRGRRGEREARRGEEDKERKVEREIMKE